MPRYRVELVESVVETCIVWIEANNPDEAERLALKQVTTGDDAEWKFKDVLDAVEVLSVQELTATEQNQ